MLFRSKNNGESFGIGSVHMRLQLVYGADVGLSIESAPHAGTKVTVCLPATAMNA